MALFAVRRTETDKGGYKTFESFSVMEAPDQETVEKHFSAEGEFNIDDKIIEIEVIPISERMLRGEESVFCVD